MNQDLIKKYGIHFKNTVFNYKIDKVPHTDVPDLTIFLFGLGVSELNEDLLHINAVLNGQEKKYETQNEMILIDVSKEEVAWRDFLLTPPFNGE